MLMFSKEYYKELSKQLEEENERLHKELDAWYKRYRGLIDRFCEEVKKGTQLFSENVDLRIENGDLKMELLILQEELKEKHNI